VVGYDDNRPAGLTGASGALPVWGELMRMLDPNRSRHRCRRTSKRVDRYGQRPARRPRLCGAIELPFVRGSAPEESAPVRPRR